MNPFVQLWHDMVKVWTTYAGLFMNGIWTTIYLAVICTAVGCLIGLLCGILNTIPYGRNDNFLKRAFLGFIRAFIRVYVEVFEKLGRVYFVMKNVSQAPLNIKAEELTERFIRGDVSRTTEGSGLGLSIAKDMTELMDGTFRIYLDGDLFRVTISFAVMKEGDGANEFSALAAADPAESKNIGQRMQTVIRHQNTAKKEGIKQKISKMKLPKLAIPKRTFSPKKIEETDHNEEL